MTQTIKQVPPERVVAAWKLVKGVRVEVVTPKPQTLLQERKES